MNPSPAFHLSKWYGDAVGEAGEFSILYSAELRWHGIAIRYGSVLDRRGPSYTLRKAPAPAVEGSAAHMAIPALGVEGHWTAGDSPLPEVTVFESAEGAVRWCCLQPRAEAVVRTQSAPAVSGLGYLEHVEMTVRPWKLPLRRLRWGRFLSRTDAVVWIDWCGDYSRRIVYHNGAPVEAGEITENGLEFAGNALRLEDARVLRDGALASTALSIVPDLDRLFPGRLLAVRERKWLSRGTLGQVSGWAIHEVVDWPQD